MQVAKGKNKIKQNILRESEFRQQFKTDPFYNRGGW